MNLKNTISAMAILLTIMAGETVPAFGIYLHLDDARRNEAMAYGARNVNTDLRVFYKEWTVDLDKQGAAILNTEFITLALATRDAALSGQEMDNFAIEDALARAQGKMVFSVSLFGKGADFAKDYEAIIKAGNKVVRATFWDQGDATPSESQPGLHVQDLFYYFPIEEISPTGKIILSIGSYSKKEKIEFSFDLSKIR